MIIDTRKMTHVMTVILSINVLVGYSAETVSYNTYHETDSGGAFDGFCHHPSILDAIPRRL
jgi:hypothetical protein